MSYIHSLKENSIKLGSSDTSRSIQEIKSRISAALRFVNYAFECSENADIEIEEIFADFDRFLYLRDLQRILQAEMEDLTAAA